MKWILLLLLFVVGCGDKCTQDNPCFDGYDEKTGTTFSHFKVVERKPDRVDKMCENSRYTMCLIADDDYGYSGHKKDFRGCGCGDTREQALGTFITGLVNQHFYVDFEVLLRKEGTSEELVDKVYSYYDKMEEKGFVMYPRELNEKDNP